MGKKKKKKTKKPKARISLIIGALVFALLLVILNFGYQIYRKPTELFNLISWTEPKSLQQTWMTYKGDFQKFSTASISPEFLAAMAQVESAGDPLASPAWRFKLTNSMENWFAPLSSSIGLYQFTKGTFKRAKNYCIYKNKSVKKGRWYQLNRCALSWMYSRLWPSHSIEVTSGYLDQTLKRILGSRKLSKRQRQRVASIVHLCGEGRAIKFIRRGFKIKKYEKCGNHSLRRYISKIENFQRHLKGK